MQPNHNINKLQVFSLQGIAKKNQHV